MTKSEFFRQLCQNLRHLAPDKQEHACQYYKGVIDGRKEAGMSEEEAISAFGSPEKAALEFINKNFSPKKHIISGKIKAMPSFFRILFSGILSASCFLGITLLWFAAVSLYVCCALIALGGLFGIILGFIFCFIRTLPIGICIIGASLTVFSLSLLLGGVSATVFKVFRSLSSAILVRVRGLLAKEALSV